MELGIIIGFLGISGVFLWSIWFAGAPYSSFIDYPSLAQVFGGGICATIMAARVKDVSSVPKVLLKMLMPKAPDMVPAIKTIVQCAEIARRDGVLALENKVQEIKDPFILLGIQMAVDGSDSELIESVMRAEMDAMAKRHKVGKSVLELAGKYAPAMGMIGTLVGLVIMLGNMDDPAAIGPGMAVALLTTLYGALLSNCFALPIADKMGGYSRREWEVREVILQGILAIQKGDNPRIVEQKLATCLGKKDRERLKAA